MKNQSHIQMWPAVLIAAVLALQPLAATAKGLGNTLQRYNNSMNVVLGGMTYQGAGGGTVPQIGVLGNSHFGDFYLGNSLSFAFGSIHGQRANRFSLNLRPGWIVPLSRNVAIVPYARAGLDFQDEYAGNIHSPTAASLNFGYALGGGLSLEWSPVHRLVINPSVDYSATRQRYARFNNQTQTHENYYLSGHETRETLNLLWYPLNWLHVGLNVRDRQFGKGSSILSYGGMVGFSF